MAAELTQQESDTIGLEPTDLAIVNSIEMGALTTGISIDDQTEEHIFAKMVGARLDNANRNEMNAVREIIADASMNGLLLKSYCDTQQTLEQYLTEKFGAVWSSSKSGPIAAISAAIFADLPQLSTYSTNQISAFIVQFEARQLMAALQRGAWTKHKFANATQREFVDDVTRNMSEASSVQTSASVLRQIYDDISAAQFTAAGAVSAPAQQTKPKRVAFDDVNDAEEEKEEEEEEKEQHLRMSQRLKELMDGDDNESILYHGVTSHSMYNKTPEPPRTHTASAFGDWQFDEIDQRYPTYLSKAIFFLSEDDTLELLIDRAISEILKFEDLWRDELFCRALYNDATYRVAVERVYKKVHDDAREYDFIEQFIERECSRQIAYFQTTVHERVDDKKQKRNHDNGDDTDSNLLHVKRGLEAQISQPKLDIRSECVAPKEYKISIDDDRSDQAYEWALFRRRRMKNVYMQNIQTSGHWQVLTRKPEDDYDEDGNLAVVAQDTSYMDEKEDKEDGGLDIMTTDLEHSVVEREEDIGAAQRNTAELNAIVVFLQTMDEASYLCAADKNKIRFVPCDLRDIQQPVIRFVFDGDADEHGGGGAAADGAGVAEEVVKSASTTATATTTTATVAEETLPSSSPKFYDVYWWNHASAGDDGVHALALKNHSSKGRMEYYVRYSMPALPKDASSKSMTKSITQPIDAPHTTMEHRQQVLEWIWFDNDTAQYKRYDLGLNVLKQMEASFHANCEDTFPKALHCNFNHLLLVEMTRRMRARGMNVGLGYVLRFGYSASDETKIVSMQQLSVFKDAPSFTRSAQRMMDGRNSIFRYFTGNTNAEYINEWKTRYLLKTQAQLKFFWAHMLAVAAATHYIAVEIRNQIITFNHNDKTTQPNTTHVLFQELKNSEVEQEQRSYVQYPGFLITPQEFFLSAPSETELQREADTSHTTNAKTTFTLLMSSARAVVLQKFDAASRNHGGAEHSENIPAAAMTPTATTATTKNNDRDLPKQYCPHEPLWRWRNAQRQFYCDECASLLQFAEFSRKFILEYEHPEVQKQLFPWYRNTLHRSDFIKYHNYVSRYNLSTLFVQSDILQMQNNTDDIIQEHFDGCFKRIKQSCNACTHSMRSCACCHPAKQASISEIEENIRYKRKFAGRFLLGGWNISRNLNILRQQFKVIFTRLAVEQNEDRQQRMIREELVAFFANKEPELSQMSERAISLNTEQVNAVARTRSTRVTRHITLHRIPFGECKNEQLWVDEISAINETIPAHYLYDCDSLAVHDPAEIDYFSKFVQSSLRAWNKHILLQRQSFLDHAPDNQSPRSFDSDAYYKHFLESWTRTPKWYTVQHDIVLLQLAMHYTLDEKQMVAELNGERRNAYISVLCADTAASSADDPHTPFYDPHTPFHEFAAWCQRWENVHHRLRYLTHCLVATLSKCTPSMTDKRVPENQHAQQKHSSSSSNPMTSIVFLNDMMPQTHLKQVSDEQIATQRSRDSAFNAMQRNGYDILPLAVQYDPFVTRRPLREFTEVLYGFDLYTHGKVMGQFLIDRLETKQRKALWILLGELLKRIPYHISLHLLTKNRELLRRADVDLFDAACRAVVDGSNFSPPIALYLSSLMQVNEMEDLARSEKWKALALRYEELAAQKINTVESDHVISILLDARIFMDEEGLLELALESRRLHFLNTETINNVISHMWQTVDFANPHRNPQFKPTVMDHWQVFQLLLFKPFYFYLCPLGFSWTTGICFIFYCAVIGVYLNLGMHQIDPFPDIESWQGIFEVVVFVSGVGYIANECKEYVDQGVTYFSVNLSNNIWDIALSVNFLILFTMRVLAGAYEIYNARSRKTYDLLWAVQCVILAIRCLRLFQTSTFLGPLLKVVGLMVNTLAKFMIILVVTFIGFGIGLTYLVNGDNADPPVTQLGTFRESCKFLFEVSVGVTELTILEDLARNKLVIDIYVSVFIVIASILLLNLLIALMTTEFEAVRQEAKEEAAYLKAQSCYDLKHRSRYIPPPINWVLYFVVVAVHILNFIPALISPNYLNVYAHLHRAWMNPLRSFAFESARHPLDRAMNKNAKHRLEHHRLIANQQLSEWDATNSNVMHTRWRVLDYYWKSVLAAWAAQPCCKWIDVQDWKIYHVNCYNVVSDGNNDVKRWNVISIEKYFEVYEKCTQSQLDPNDKHLVSHLTDRSSCVFCKYCNRSITTSETHLKSQLLTPFWVLADIISCWTFLLVLYVPMTVVLFIIGAAERMVFHRINDNYLMEEGYDEDVSRELIETLSKLVNPSTYVNKATSLTHQMGKSIHFELKSMSAKKSRELRDYSKQYHRKNANMHM